MQRSCRVQRIHENDFVETGNWPKRSPELIGIFAVQSAVADTVLESQPPFPVLVPNSVDFANFLADADAQVAGQFGNEKTTGVMVRRTAEEK